MAKQVLEIEAQLAAMRATMTTLQAQMDALQAQVARADSVEQEPEQESAQEQVMEDVPLDEMESDNNEASFDESDSPSGSESDQEETADAQGDSIAAVRLAKYEQSICNFKVDVTEGHVPRLRDHDTKTLLAGGPAPQPWSKETLKRFQQSVNLVHRRLDAELLLEHGVEEPDFRDEGGEHQYGWVLFEEAVLDACGIDMDKLRSAQSTKTTGREDAGRIETGIRLLESIRDLCLMVRSAAHVKASKKYSDILGELRTMATQKRGVARDTWRSKDEARAELTRLQQCVLDKLGDTKCGDDLSLIIMALVMVSTDENDTLQPLRTGTADGLAYSGTPAATDDKCKGIVHVAEGEPVTLESIRHTKTGRVLSEPLDLDDGCPALATALRMHREHACQDSRKWNGWVIEQCSRSTRADRRASVMKQLTQPVTVTKDAKVGDTKVHISETPLRIWYPLGQRKRGSTVTGDEALCDGCTVAKVLKKDGEKTMTLASALSLPLKAGTVLHVSTPYSTNECRHLRVTADMGPLRKRKRAAELRGSSVGAMASYGGR
ncbi:hypothetical protein N9K47_00355 [bacterium]|nr:hypothetical protein [bacterium]